MCGMPRHSASPLLTEEILEQTGSQVQLSGSYLLYMACSGVLAAVALLSSSVPILIGSMIVAPLMPPLALVPFALAAGRRAEAARGLGVALVGLVLAFVAAWATVAVMDLVGVIPAEVVLLNQPMLEERVRPGWWSVAAALAAGLAGTVAQARAKTDTLIGTVAALALVPAVGASALALFAGAPERALGGALLLVLNVGLIVAMGIVGVLAAAGRQGLRPLLLVPVAIVAVVGLLVGWAQSTGTVPKTPVTSRAPSVVAS
jgi:uncharacterized hydrophobic protein (TIGR00271 family)